MEITSIDPFINYYSRLRERTKRVIACIPPDKIEWTYREGKFTLGDIIRHLGALERYTFAENARRRPTAYRGHGRDLADGYQAVVAYLDKTHTETIEILRGLTDTDLQAKTKTPAGEPITVWKWLRAMAEHEIHHRGQIYIYLGMLGVETPPLYGLTSEDVASRAANSIA